MLGRKLVFRIARTQTFVFQRILKLAAFGRDRPLSDHSVMNPDFTLKAGAHLIVGSALDLEQEIISGPWSAGEAKSLKIKWSRSRFFSSGLELRCCLK